MILNTSNYNLLIQPFLYLKVRYFVCADVKIRASSIRIRESCTLKWSAYTFSGRYSNSFRFSSGAEKESKYLAYLGIQLNFVDPGTITGTKLRFSTIRDSLSPVASTIPKFFNILRFIVMQPNNFFAIHISSQISRNEASISYD